MLESITKEEINELAKKHIKTDQMYIVIVADKDVVMEGLSKLPYEIEVLNLSADVAVD
jgi:zinc protease